MCLWQALYMGGRVGSLRSRVSFTFDAKGEAHCQFSSFQWFLGCFCGPKMVKLDQCWCRWYAFPLFLGGFGMIWEYFPVVFFFNFGVNSSLCWLETAKGEYPIALVEPTSNSNLQPPNQTFQSTSRRLFSPQFVWHYFGFHWILMNKGT